MPNAVDPHRDTLLRDGVRLELFTIAWMVLEAAVALGAGWRARSIALVAFGLDSAVELVSGGVLFYRLRAEIRGRSEEGTEDLERRALRVVGLTFFLLVIYIAWESVMTITRHEVPEASRVGIGLAVAALVVMPALGFAKRRVGARLGSGALMADAKETFVCAYLSFTLLLGLVLNAILGWWWADPVAALVMVPFLVHEGWEALEEVRNTA